MIAGILKEGALGRGMSVSFIVGDVYELHPNVLLRYKLTASSDLAVVYR
jgi:hypothetical protein